jgi:hypothetical protein
MSKARAASTRVLTPDSLAFSTRRIVVTALIVVSSGISAHAQAHPGLARNQRVYQAVATGVILVRDSRP